MNRFEYCHPDNNSDNDSFGSFLSKKIVSFATYLGVNLHFMKVSTEIDNNFGYEKITQLVDNIPLSKSLLSKNYKTYILPILDYGCELWND